MKQLRYLLMVIWLILTAAVVTPAQAQEAETDSEPLNCIECHDSTYAVWEQSAHAEGLTCQQCHMSVMDDFNHPNHGLGDDGLKECADCHTTGHNAVTNGWDENNIYCTACHTVISGHPDQLIPTDRSETLCGNCHVQTLHDWQESAHGQAGIACVSCHLQHGATLRKGDVSSQCATCHGSRVEAFSHSEHGAQGLSCADCHLGTANTKATDPSAANHSFKVEVSACVACHDYQLHDEEGATAVVLPIHSTSEITPATPLDAMSSRITTEISLQPNSANHWGWLIAIVTLSLATLITIAPRLKVWGQKVWYLWVHWRIARTTAQPKEGK